MKLVISYTNGKHDEEQASYNSHKTHKTSIGRLFLLISLNSQYRCVHFSAGLHRT